MKVEDEAEFARAFTLMSHGMDFADAFHLVGARGCEAFATFDKDLARRAAKAAPGSVRLL